MVPGFRMVTGCRLQLLVMTVMVTALAGQEPPQPEDPTSKEWIRRYLSSLTEAQNRKTVGQSQLIQQWGDLEFEWPCDYVKDFYQRKGLFEPAENVLAGIDVYKNDTFVTVYRSSDKVPAGLNKVIVKNGKSLLQPYPNLTVNELGNCSNLQFPIATSTDPNSGYIYVIDLGGVKKLPTSSEHNSAPANKPQACSPKIVVLDIKKNGMVVRSHDLVSAEPRNTSYLKDIVLDYVNKNSTKVKYAYITDVGNQRLIVFNFDTNTSHSFEHDSMTCEPGVNSTADSKYNRSFSINGIALDPEFEYVYYNCLGSRQVSQIPTSVLREKLADFADKHRYVGNTTAEPDRMVCGKRGLYYGGVNSGTVNRWNIKQDMEAQNVTKDGVTIKSETEIFKNGTKDSSIDSLKLDTTSYLWLTQRADPSDTKGSNYKIYRVFVNDKSIMSRDSDVPAPN